MTTPDPFDQIADRLRRAHGVGDHADAPESDRDARPRRAGAGRGRITVIAVLIGLAAGGTATAAVLVAGRGPSRPLEGPITAGSPSNDRYVVRIGPSLDAGDTSWCATAQVRLGGSTVGGSGCGGAAARDRPVIAAGGLIASSPDRSSVVYAVVDERVAAMRLPSGRRVTPVRAPELPDGWRAIVATPPGSEDTSDLVFEDREGHEIGAATRRSFLPVQATTSAGSTAARTAAPCSLASTGPARLGTQRVLRDAPKPAPTANGRPFLACSSVVARLDGRRFVAAVLLDARTPGRRPAPLPGATRSPDGTYESFPAVSARRAGDAWIVVRGVDDRLRRRVLRGLRAHRAG